MTNNGYIRRAERRHRITKADKAVMAAITILFVLLGTESICVSIALLIRGVM